MKCRFFSAGIPTFALTCALIASATESGHEADTKARNGESKNNTDEKKKEAEPPILPVLDRCVLDADERTLKPAHVSETTLWAHAVGDLRMRIKDDTVHAYKSGKERPLWMAKAPSKTH